MAQTPHHELSEEEFTVDYCFSLFDKDKNGTISLSEFGTGLRYLGFNPSDKELRDFMKQFDKDGSGRIDISEFRNMFSCYEEKKKQQKMTEEEQILTAFRLFDKDNDGYIDKHELKKIMKSLGDKTDDDFIEEMIASADSDQDGKINIKEFSKFICAKH